MESVEKDGKKSKNFALHDRKASLKLLSEPENVPRLEYSGVSSGPSEVTEPENCQWPKNISAFLQHLANKRICEGVDDIGHQDGLRNVDLEGCKDGGHRSQRYPLKSSKREAQNTQHCVSDGEDDAIRDEASLPTPLATSSLESLESESFGIQFATGNASIKARAIMDANAESCCGSDGAEAGYSSISKGVESCPPLRVHADVVKAPRQRKKVCYGALDLLLKAVQLTSDSLFAEEEDKLPRCSDEEKDGRHGRNDSQLLSVQAHFVYGRSSVFKKRVLRRAKSAFKKSVDRESVEETLELEVSANITVPPSCKRARKRQTSKQQSEVQDELTDGKPSFLEVRCENDGDPVIRSKRGRFQALPTKFCDSVLQPW
eukprot:c30205_g1_i1 orf=3-1121(-)